jgi:hypothetical protein
MMERYTEEKLYKLWKKYIDTNLYKVVSEEYLPSIRKKGFQINKDPFSKKKSEIKKLFEIILRLEKRGLIYHHKIGQVKVKGSYLAKRSSISMNKKLLDFTNSYEQARKFKRKWRGGALTVAVSDLSNFLMSNKNILNKREIKLIKNLISWANKKRRFENKMIFIKGSDPIFENAKLQYNLKVRKNQGYYPSPYGSFNNFKKIIKQEGYKKYEPYLKKTKKAYIRVTKSISPKSIVKVS